MCCCGEPAHARDGHEWVSTLLLTHHRSPPSNNWHVVLKNSLRVVATESWADGPACCSRGWTPVSATLSLRAGNSERIRNHTTPTLVSRAETASANPHVHSRSCRHCWITDGGIPPLKEWEEVKRGLPSPQAPIPTRHTWESECRRTCLS